MKKEMDFIKAESAATNIVSLKFVEEENEIKGNIDELQNALDEAKSAHQRDVNRLEDTIHKLKL